MKTQPTHSQLEALRRMDTCTVANTLESFEIRLRDEGFTDARISCCFPKLGTMLGYAATVKIRCAGPPTEGHSYLDRTDWWEHIQSIAVPRIVVVEDIGPMMGNGAFLGEVHTSILKALNCVGAITNGAVRDLAAVEKSGFHLFSGSRSVSHAYAHIVSIGEPVEVAGLKICPGDLLHGDQHGVLHVPEELVPMIPAAAAKRLTREHRIIALCRSSEFTTERLKALLITPD